MEHNLATKIVLFTLIGCFVVGLFYLAIYGIINDLAFVIFNGPSGVIAHGLPAVITNVGTLFIAILMLSEAYHSQVRNIKPIKKVRIVTGLSFFIGHTIGLFSHWFG